MQAAIFGASWRGPSELFGSPDRIKLRLAADYQGDAQAMGKFSREVITNGSKCERMRYTALNAVFWMSECFESDVMTMLCDVVRHFWRCPLEISSMRSKLYYYIVIYVVYAFLHPCDYCPLYGATYCRLLWTPYILDRVTLGTSCLSWQVWYLCFDMVFFYFYERRDTSSTVVEC